MPTTEYSPYRGTHKCSDIDAAIDRSIANAAAIATKQDALTTAQLAAVNSGIDSTKVSAIASNTASIAENALAINAQGTEIANARTNADGEAYQTLKERLDVSDSLVAKSNASILPSCDLDDVNENGVWLLTSGNTYDNFPSNVSERAGYLFSFLLGGWNVQFFVPFVQGNIYRRASNALNPFGDWVKITEDEDLANAINSVSELVSHNNEFNRFDAIYKNAIRSNITDAGITYSWSGDVCTISGTASGNSFCNIFNSYLNVSDFKAGKSYYLLFNDSVSSQVYMRIYFSSDGSSWSDPVNLTKSGYFTIPAGTVRMTIRFQVNTGTTVSCNSYCYAITHAPIEHYSENQAYRLDSCDLNDLHGNQSWLIASTKTYENLPDDKNHTAGYLFTYEIGGWRLQLFLPFSWTGIYRRATNSDSWQNWTQIAESGGGDIYNITNEYTVEATPTITSDTNNYLAPTGDNSDVKYDIITMLTQNGVCRLGPGDYYVSGVDMPNDTMLIGSGAKTRVILLGSNSTTGYAIKLGNRCSVKDMSIVGSTTDIRYSDVSSSIVDRHGILFEAQYDYDESNKERCNVENVWIRFFTGGGITCRNTGYGTASCLNVSNAYIYQCNAGVYIPYWSEFHRFTNVHARYCYYGAVNNGGNCSFVNCCFSSNRVGMLMDNSTDQARNNSHGQVVACIFDHSDENNGVGLLIDGMRNGEIFSDCQVFYSDIVVRNSSGIQFNNFNFGGSGTDITVEKGSQGGLIMFNNCVFEVSSHTITVEQGYTACKFVNCWKKDGTAVTG